MNTRGGCHVPSPTAAVRELVAAVGDQRRAIGRAAGLARPRLEHVEGHGVGERRRVVAERPDLLPSGDVLEPGDDEAGAGALGGTDRDERAGDRAAVGPADLRTMPASGTATRRRTAPRRAGRGGRPTRTYGDGVPSGPAEAIAARDRVVHGGDVGGGGARSPVARLRSDPRIELDLGRRQRHVGDDGARRPRRRAPADRLDARATDVDVRSRAPHPPAHRPARVHASTNASSPTGSRRPWTMPASTSQPSSAAAHRERRRRPVRRHRRGTARRRARRRRAGTAPGAGPAAVRSTRARTVASSER